MRFRNKNGSLNLSIQAIVILVMAMAILGLGLGFIRTLIGKGQTQFTTAIDNAELENPASADNPMTLDRSVSVKSGDTGRMKIGFYNGGTTEITGAEPKLKPCKPSTGTTVRLASGPQTIGVGVAKGWEALLTDSGSTVGSTTICTIVFEDNSGGVVASKQFQVTITS